MNNDYTHVSLVLDRSGSMNAIKTDTIGGFNRLLKDQQNAPGQCSFTLVQFDGQGIDTLYDAKPIRDVVPLNDHTYMPRASTPLYDAVGQTIIRTGDFLAKMPANLRPAKVVFVIITDGEENASREYTLAKIKEMVQHQTDAYKWQFVFLGANFDAYAVGGAMGMSASNSMNVAANAVGTQSMYASTSSNLRSFRSGAKSDMSYDAMQKAEQTAAGADNTGH